MDSLTKVELGFRQIPGVDVAWKILFVLVCNSIAIMSCASLAQSRGCPPVESSGPKIVVPPAGMDPFYTKAVESSGIQVIASMKTCDRSLQVAYEIAHKMLSKRPDIEKTLADQKAYIAVFSTTERLTDLPEDRDLAGRPTGADPALTFDDLCGGGGVHGRPTAICERNLLGIKDPFFGRMSVLIHEFGHTIQNLGLDATSLAAIHSAYTNALSLNLFPPTRGSGTSWMMSNESEFFAEGTGTWFNAADPGNPANSPDEKGRDHLKLYAPELYKVLSGIYPDDKWDYPRN